VNRGLPVVVFCSFAAVALAQSPAPDDLEAILERADARRQEYVKAFKDLIAIETRLIEIIDRNGRVEKQRVVVSDFLVYPSSLKDDLVSEYRIAREVDGRPVRTSAEDAIKQFQRLASSKTLAQESERLKEANLKYALRYFTWGATLHPLRMLDWRRRLGMDFVIAGREGVAGRDAIVLDYRLKESREIRAQGIYRHFDSPRSGTRGRAWIDASDGRLLRWENETTVADRDILTPVAVLRYETEYEPSPFGVWTPKRVVASFVDKVREKNASPTVRLAGRLTFTYADFKRFSVSTTTDIKPPDR
jgi:hypothetical protein